MDLPHSFFYACGPAPMLRAVCEASPASGEVSLDARMGCGFGACMGCTIQTVKGPGGSARTGRCLRRRNCCGQTERFPLRDRACKPHHPRLRHLRLRPRVCGALRHQLPRHLLHEGHHPLPPLRQPHAPHRGGARRHAERRGAAEPRGGRGDPEELPRLAKVFHKPVMANVSGFSVEEYVEVCARWTPSPRWAGWRSTSAAPTSTAAA